MTLSVTYVKDYGWHVGRPIVWVALLIVGIPTAFLALFAEGAVAVVARVRVPLALIVPIAFSSMAYLRLRRKMNGEPFAFNPPGFFLDDMTTLLIYRGHRHHRALMMIEAFIWGSVPVLQLAIIGLFYAQYLWRR